LARIEQPGKKIPFPPYLSKPSWPWHLDQNEFGTRDFRATKYNIYQAELVGPDGSGMRVYSDGTTDVRANLSPEGVQLHLLLGRQVSRDKANLISLAPVNLATGERLSGNFTIQLLPASDRD
jgi:hypothetical protein